MYVQQFQADLPILHFVVNLWAVDLNGRMHLHLSINLKKVYLKICTFG